MNLSQHDQIISIRVANGNINHIRTVTISGRTIISYVFNRASTGDFINLIENDRKTGIYILYGKDIQTESTLIYIGLSDNINKRIKVHHREDPSVFYWSETIVFTTSIRELNISHIKYLESELLRLTEQTPNVTIKNHNASHLPNISDNDKVVADNFLADLLMVVNAFNLSFFEFPMPSFDFSDLPVFYYQDRRGIEYNAKMVIYNGKYVVLSGSLIRRRELKSCLSHTREKRKILKKSKSIKIKDKNSYIAKKHLVFNSPSFAASVVSGSNVNGWLVWKDDAGKRLNGM